MTEELNKGRRTLQCRNTGEIFIAGQEYVGGHEWGNDLNYTWRAMSLNGYLSEAKHNNFEAFIQEVNGIEEVELEELK